MSLSAYIWAANLPLTAAKGAPYRVLLQLADRADELGRGAYPHIGTIAAVLECSERTVYRAIDTLLEAGLIRRGDQRFVAHLDPRYRPTVYDVMTTALKVIEAADSDAIQG